MLADADDIFLQLESLTTGYGKRQVLGGVTLAVRKSEIVAVIGHNGSGKSTLLKAIYGIIPIWDGRLHYDGREIKKPHPRGQIAGGLTYVPQGNRVFGDLTVRENLEVAGVMLPSSNEKSEGIERALSEYTTLKGRMKQRAATLSGGEKQMLSLAMALVLSPRMMLLDEPSLGLAPPLASEALHRVQTLSRERGVSILIVEQKVREVLKIADRVYVLRTGKVSFSGRADELKDEQKLREMYL